MGPAVFYANLQPASGIYNISMASTVEQETCKKRLPFSTGKVHSRAPKAKRNQYSLSFITRSMFKSSCLRFPCYKSTFFPTQDHKHNFFKIQICPYFILRALCCQQTPRPNKYAKIKIRHQKSKIKKAFLKQKLKTQRLEICSISCVLFLKLPRCFE